MAHTIDHKEEAVKIQESIAARDNRKLETGQPPKPSYAERMGASMVNAWEGAKRIDNKWDPFEYAASAAAHSIEFMIPQTQEELLFELATLGQGAKLKLGNKLVRKAISKGVEPAFQKGKQVIGDLLNPKQMQLAEAGVGNVKSSNTLQIQGGEGVVQRTATTQQIKSLLKDLDPSLAKRDVTKRYADNPEFLKKLSEVNASVKEWLSGKGKGRLKGYTGERVIVAPDGVKYRVRDSNLQGQTGKFSINQDISAQNTAKIRKIAQQPDEGSLKKIFSKHVPKNKVDAVLTSYNQTNKKIYTALTAARKRYNIGKPKDLQTSIEHIFDVDFYKRLKDEVPGFAGKGADEAWNLKMIPYVLNSKTGALNKKAKDIGQTLIDAVRKDEFIDYNKVVKEFVDFDLGTKINKLKPKDWDKITEFSMKNPDLNMQQILLEYTKNL